MLGARLKSWVEAHLGRAKRRKQKQSRPAPPVPSTGSIPPPPHLSSPESAYSTGYSTDGTSPGAPPVTTLAAPLVAPPPPPAPPTTHLYHEPSKVTVYFCVYTYTVVAVENCFNGLFIKMYEVVSLQNIVLIFFLNYLKVPI